METSNYTLSKKNFSLEAAVIRFVASWLVIIHHTIILVFTRAEVHPGYELVVTNILRAATLFAVPLFILLSGALHLGSNFSSGRHHSWKIARLFLVYVCWTGFYLYFKKQFLGQNFSLSTVAQHILNGSGEYHLRFIPIILGLYAATPLIKKIRLKYKMKGTILLLSVSLIYAVVIWTMNDFFLAKSFEEYFGPLYFLRYLFLYIAGGIIWNFRKRYNKLFLVSLIVIHLSVVTIYSYFESLRLGYSTLFLYLDRYYAPHYIFTASVSFFLLLNFRYNWLSEKLIKNIILWNKQSETVYFLHPLCIYALSLLAMKYGIFLQNVNIFLLFALSLGVGVMSYYCSFLLQFCIMKIKLLI